MCEFAGGTMEVAEALCLIGMVSPCGANGGSICF